MGGGSQHTHTRSCGFSVLCVSHHRQFNTPSYVDMRLCLCSDLMVEECLLIGFCVQCVSGDWLQLDSGSRNRLVFDVIRRQFDGKAKAHPQIVPNELGYLVVN